MCKATYDRLYKLYRKNGMSESQAEYRAKWFAENRARIWNQGMAYAYALGITGVAVRNGEVVRKTDTPDELSMELVA